LKVYKLPRDRNTRVKECLTEGRQFCNSNGIHVEKFLDIMSQRVKKNALVMERLERIYGTYKILGQHYS